AGVDVFFVISGFLMTGIIFRGIEQENFSILKFYVARANRIIPALAVLCLVLLVFGWFYLTPLDYRALGKHVGSSMGFLSNIIYWRESGYFDAASHEKWLLHTWSLSAEWQFYIIYPLVLVAMRKFMSLKAMKATVLVGTVLGFIFCVIATYKWPNPAYYLLPTRAWEMMIGGVAYLYPLKLAENRKKAFEWVGLALILFSYLFISKENLWPGYLALIPVLGAFLLIQSQRNDSIVTGNIIFQSLGKWSYSIYLWHWPLVVAIYYFDLNEQFIYFGVILSVILGFISNRYIESIKFKNDFNRIFTYIKCYPLYMVIFVGLFGSITFISRGFEWHYNNEVILASNEAVNKNPYKCMEEKKFPCYIGNANNIKAIIVGDSHADALTTSLSSAFDLEKSGIIALTKSSCPFILGIKSTKSGAECLEENERRLKILKEKYINTPIFWVARSSVYIKGQSNPDRIKDIRDTKPSIYFSEYSYEELNKDLLNEIDSALKLTLNEINDNRDVYLVLPTPEMRVNVPKKISRSLLLGHRVDAIGVDKSLYIDRNKEILDLFNKLPNKISNVTLLDPTIYLCDNNTCYGDYDGRPIYYDGDHMSEFGNKLLTPMFLSVVK
ncbi:acyltransferase, partial [Vibrio metschnikovii]|nr:acyltransferase [Vibrio metschnikovii]